MNCHEFETQLDQAIDGRQLANASAVREHAEACIECAHKWQDYLLVESAIAGWHKEPFEVEIVDHVIEAAREEGLIASNGSTVPDDLRSPMIPQEIAPSSVGMKSVRRFWPTIVTVALVLVAAVLVLRDRPDQVAHDDPPNPDPVEIVELPEYHYPPESEEEPPNLDALLADARQAWLGITRRAGRRADDFRVFVPDISNDLGIEPESSETQLDDDESREESAPDRIQRAFDFLFEASGPPPQQTT